MTQQVVQVPGEHADVYPAPRVSFDTFIDAFQWKQGQHLALIGPTNSGKTTLATELLPKQPYVTVLATKPRDTTMDRLGNSGYKIMRKWPTGWPYSSVKKYPRRIIWPPIDKLDDATIVKQTRVFTDTMAAIYGEGGWCLYIDELYYIIQQLGMDKMVKMYLLQARSLGISLAVATQRPYWVPLEVYDQSTHLFFWRDNDERNLQRLGGISWRSAQQIRQMIANLGEHEFLYIHTATGGMIRSKVERKATR